MPVAPGWRALSLRRAVLASPNDKALPHLVPAEPVSRALKDLLTEPNATPSLAMARLALEAPLPGKGVPLERAWKEEFALWLFRILKGAAAPTSWTAELLNKHAPENALSFFSGLRRRAKGRPFRYLDMQEVRDADRLDKLLSLLASETEDHEALSACIQWLNGASAEQEGYFLGRPPATAPG